jgi:hypothetical protein
LVLVAEVVNWSIGSRLTNKRKNNYIRNLTRYSCNRLFIYTTPLSNLSGFKENGIDLLEIGYQILPESYYNYFIELDRIERRKILSDVVMRDIGSKICEYVYGRIFGYDYLISLFPRTFQAHHFSG